MLISLEAVNCGDDSDVGTDSGTIPHEELLLLVLLLL